MTDESVLRVSRIDAVSLVQLDRPARLNALNAALLRQLVAALHAAAADGARAVVITGDERAFAAGADITELREPPGPDLEAFDAIWACELPLVAAVRGLALGGGLELAMSCDLLVVADDARLGQPEIGLGLIPGAGGTQRLTSAVGKTLAMEMLLLRRELRGSEAYARGLANACVPAERVVPHALALAADLAAAPPLAVRAAKRAVLDAFEVPLHTSLLRERHAFRALLATDDAQEGISAFVDKRDPVWSGK